MVMVITQSVLTIAMCLPIHVVNPQAFKANQKEHKKNFKKKKGLMRGGSVTLHDQGEVADEDPVTLVLTERSIRIVDRIGGETMFKTLLTDVAFTCAFKQGPLSVFAFIASMDQLGSKRCYFFADRTQDGEKLMDLIRTTKKKNDDVYGVYIAVPISSSLSLALALAVCLCPLPSSAPWLQHLLGPLRCTSHVESRSFQGVVKPGSHPTPHATGIARAISLRR